MYWTERDFAGIGPAAHSFRGGERSWNHAAWNAYEEALLAGRGPTADRERLTDLQRTIERIYLGLRTKEGLEKALWRVPNAAVERAWKEQSWVYEDGDRYKLTATGWLRLDEIVAVLTTSAVSG